MLAPTVAVLLLSLVAGLQCPDQQHCGDEQTCCQGLLSGEYKCCPFQQALCCNGGEHCCPKGYACRGDSCVQSAWPQVDILPLTSTGDSAPLQTQSNIDCGGGFTCDDTQTCCKMSETTWGCCPFPKAVCCSDMLHCCPTGYICDGAGSCSQERGFGWNHWENFLRKKKRAVRL